MSGSLVQSIQQAFAKTPTPTPMSKHAPSKSQYDNWDDYWLNKPYGGSGFDDRGFKPTYPRVQGYTPAVTKKVAVVLDNGAEDLYTVPYDCEGWFKIAESVWPTVNNVMRVPVSHCQFTYREPTFNACVYTATNDYMQARWGRRLDDSDRRWLAAHPYATNSGIPQEYTATCISQLIEPYGMRVSRIRLRKGSLVLGDPVMFWIQALGCNPFAMADRSTSNAEAAARMGMTVEQANELWRVEFHDEPLPCSIIGERGWSSGNGVVTGAMGGHARYLAPRSGAGDWFISVQLDSSVSYLVPPPNPEYVPRKGEPTLLISEVTGPDGQRIAEKVSGQWKPLNAPAPAPTAAVALEVPELELTPPHDDVPHQANFKLVDHDDMYCMVCGTEQDTVLNMMVEGDVCLDCLEEAWRGYRCPHCNESFAKQQPSPMSAGLDEYEWECHSCKGVLSVSAIAERGDQHYALTELSYALFCIAPTAREQADGSPPAYSGLLWK